MATTAHARPGSVTTSLDGSLRASIKFGRGEIGAAGDPPSSLWITDLRTKRERLLFRGRTDVDPKRNTASIDQPRFSFDGSHIYVEADAYATSTAIHEIDVHSGEQRYVTDGGLIGIVRDGPWRGFLLVGQHRYWPGGGSYDPVVVVRADGYVALTVPGSEQESEDAVAPWLSANGWHLS